MKKIPYFTAICCLALLSSCTRPLAKQNTTVEETSLPDVTVSAPSTSTSSRAPEAYDIKDNITSQVTGEVGERFLYLTQHLTDTKVQLSEIFHGCFTQTQSGELLVTYVVENAPDSNGGNPTFLFVLNVQTGELESSHFVTADEVNVYVLPSPVGNKIFITQTSQTADGLASAATIYSCMSGIWSKSNAISNQTTMAITTDEGEEQLSTDYIYTYNGETLTVESQTFENGVATLDYSGSYPWNGEFLVFKN